MTKEEYRINREASKRGQGEYPNPVVGIDATPATSHRGLGLRKKRSATKVSKFSGKSWDAHRVAQTAKVLAREFVAKQKAAERRDAADSDKAPK